MAASRPLEIDNTPLPVGVACVMLRILVPLLTDDVRVPPPSVMLLALRVPITPLEPLSATFPELTVRPPDALLLIRKLRPVVEFICTSAFALLTSKLFGLKPLLPVTDSVTPVLTTRSSLAAKAPVAAPVVHELWVNVP